MRRFYFWGWFKLGRHTVTREGYVDGHDVSSAQEAWFASLRQSTSGLSLRGCVVGSEEV